MTRTKVTIPEIELNFCNKCLANCFICAKPHGSKNIELMPPSVFDVVMVRLEQVDFKVIQTSGNGDAFLNPFYFKYLQELRENFPGAEIHFYSSFSLLNKKKADFFIEKDLIDFIFTRIDTLNPDIFHKSTGGLRLPVVLDNIKYFAERNRNIEFQIGYSNIKTYYDRCSQVLGRRPRYNPFPGDIVDMIFDEFENIQSYFNNLNITKPLKFRRINQSLWAERSVMDPDYNAPCPKLGGAIKRTIWICPNGDVSVCGYDDSQGDLIAGNIINESIKDIWLGNRRKEILQGIKDRRYTGYPCINPRCCRMYSQE
jgi:MoaA/NifB/PqqE/SkfB family radical SAM enzyme